ncbi:MAG: ParB/RepB/Spo0J family partition protein [Bacteroidota bacterium]|nr:ParB/RepB/Spo0J family partition protein [Bacteroidota bacterium]
MNNKKAPLGKGLASLLSNSNTDITSRGGGIVNSISEIKISEIEANPFQPRTEFDDAALEELSESIKLHGIIQPITVRKVGGGKYELISGERRTRAARRAGLAVIPAYIRVADDQGMLEMALIENIHREDLNPIEVALSYKRLAEECNLKHDDLADRVGKSRTAVTNYLRLLKLPEEIQIAVRDEAITIGHARPLISVDDKQEQLQLLEQIIDQDLNVRQVEELIRTRNLVNKPKDKAKKLVHPAIKDYMNYSSKFKDASGLNVKIVPRKNGRGGNVTFSFTSEEQLKNLLDTLDKN